MKNSFALLAVLCMGISVAHAQTSPSSSEQAPLHRAPGTAAPAASSSSAAPQDGTARPNTADKPPVAVPPEEEKAIRRLMALLGTDKIAEGLDQSLHLQLRDAMTKRGMPDDRLKQFLQDFEQDYARLSPDSKVNDALVEVFASHLSAEDINGLVQFYESPLGNRFMDALPYISQSSQQEGAKIVRDQAISTLRQMSDQYPEVKQLLPPDSKAPSGEQESPVRPIPDQTPRLESSPSTPPDSSATPQKPQ
jgi:uncharacterized protein